MTLQELYQTIGGDYQQALRVLRVDRLLDKHIRKMPANDVFPRLIAARDTMDAIELFESAHAAKGVCANLGLVEMSELASQVAEEFRPGRARSLADDEVARTIDRFAELYGKTVEGVRQYEAG